MKILATADLHGSQYRLNLLLKNIDIYQPELVILCGDLTQFGPGDVAKQFLDQIPVQTLAVPGNIDSQDVSEAIDTSRAINIDMKRIEKNNIAFVGLSGIHPQQIGYVLAKKTPKIDKHTVLISHVPPYGLQDNVFLGMHSGSKELRGVVDICKPRLVLCGHIHEDPGYTSTKHTIVVNCSMGKRGEGALIDITDTINVKMVNQK